MLFSTKMCIAFALIVAVLASPASAQLLRRREARRPVAVTAKKEVVGAAKMDIVDTAVKAGSFKTLATALEAAGLVETLKGKGPYTVFAPTDTAFAKLPSGTLESLLKPENKEHLVAILTYHVLPENTTAAEVMKMKSAKTVNGESVMFKTEGDSVYVDNAKMTKTDIACTNGEIHIVDTVLMPKE
jgi:transforming growth factor-beta-induced protein